ncbi:LOW QUALITY PROTEIN: venom serine carboxypeptidase [Dermacentor silvarum]|uniref:LOW QUALITY PROTEIN: venom serine carboxypeptidase n=1 Tax=Dermacentor silvarum TaxID=543639 RepID=UPI002100FE58|nr:LOW QUALITY PROTEIN: venom serine carboxypeptidase [Dermacentor silvarum]
MELAAAVVLLLCAGHLTVLGTRAADRLQARQDVAEEPEASNDDDAGQPLFLTPLIKEGKLEEAKSKSKVGPLGADREVPGYSGYITVNPQYNSNLFFWFVPSLSDPDNAPVILWMQGGPGTTSMLGFFAENGPYVLSADGSEIKYREINWATRYSVLYVDQPVGTGFSFTENEAGYARNQTDVGRDMLEFLQQFFTLFGELAENELYLSGESYAGKYVPTVGATLHENADSMRVKLNFRGIAYGNGITDPINMMFVGEVIYGVGLIDRSAADYMMSVAREAVQHIRAGNTYEALMLMDKLFFGIVTEGKGSTFFKNVTGYSYYYNYLTHTEPNGSRAYKVFLPKPRARRALHVGDRKFSTTREVVVSHFLDDFMRSAVPQFTEVLENGYKVLVYSGPLDLCVPTTMSENFLAHVAWAHADRWTHAPQHTWWSADGQQLYWLQEDCENLNFVVVRNGGHELPYDQPEAMMELITAFIDGTKPFADESATTVE